MAWYLVLQCANRILVDQKCHLMYKTFVREILYIQKKVKLKN